MDLWSKQQNGESIRLLYGLLKKRDSFMMFENSLLVICRFGTDFFMMNKVITNRTRRDVLFVGLAH